MTLCKLLKFFFFSSAQKKQLTDVIEGRLLGKLREYSDSGFELRIRRVDTELFQRAIGQLGDDSALGHGFLFGDELMRFTQRDDEDEDDDDQISQSRSKSRKKRDDDNDDDDDAAAKSTKKKKKDGKDKKDKKDKKDGKDTSKSKKKKDKDDDDGKDKGKKKDTSRSKKDAKDKKTKDESKGKKKDDKKSAVAKGGASKPAKKGAEVGLSPSDSEDEDIAQEEDDGQAERDEIFNNIEDDPEDEEQEDQDESPQSQRTQQTKKSKRIDDDDQAAYKPGHIRLLPTTGNQAGALYTDDSLLREEDIGIAPPRKDIFAFADKIGKKTDKIANDEADIDKKKFVYQSRLFITKWCSKKIPYLKERELIRFRALTARDLCFVSILLVSASTASCSLDTTRSS